LVLAVLAILWPRQHRQAAVRPSEVTVSPNPESHVLPSDSASQSPRRGNSFLPARTAEEIVAEKVKQFGRIRRQVVRRIAARLNKQVPPDVEAFFDAVEGGSWDEIKARFHPVALYAGRYDYSTTHDPALDSFWRPVQEAFGAVQEEHIWPAQRLLDYGNAVLESLRPGMVYLGGTDPGCFIPTMMNETGDGEHHIVLTQNALADSDYLDYLNFLYEGQIALPTHDDSQRAFEQYTADAKQRYLHDQQFPDEPKQLKPGENVSFDSDGKVNVSGQVAVMQVNELIVKAMLDKNPTLSFALEESFPFKSTYSDAVPLGPIMELRASIGNGASSQTADESLAYWKDVAQGILSEPDASQQQWTRAYAKMMDSQANLFAAQNLNDQAEQSYQLALQINPSIPDTVFGYANLLQNEGRSQDALRMAQAAAQADPGNKQLQGLVQHLSGIGAPGGGSTH
jgi:hypothetical protein